MRSASGDDEKLKKLVKAAVVEVLEERRDFLQEAIMEALEDFALARAIEEGRHSKTVSRAEVFSALDGGQRTSASGRALLETCEG